MVSKLGNSSRRRFVESEFGFGAVSLLLAAPIFIPMYWLGLWWVGFILAVGIGFIAGWSAARRRFLRTGDLPKI